MYSTISADIINSTSLSKSDTVVVQKRLKEFACIVPELSEGGWGRVVKGDGFEAVLENPNDALRVALALKCYVKCFEAQSKCQEFKRYGIRIAVGIGDLRTNDPKNGIIDGEAIYASGRIIEEKTILSRGTLMISSATGDLELLQTLASLCETIINDDTPKQCEVLYHKLCGVEELKVAEILGKERSTVNEHSQKAGWPAIERAVSYFESIKF